MQNSDWTTKAILLLIAVFLGVLALRPVIQPSATVLAQPARFDHVMIASTSFLYKGFPGMLVMDKRNGNVWFYQRANESFKDPVFVIRLEFEKIDRNPQ
jgi:hypothetical protein